MLSRAAKQSVCDPGMARYSCEKRKHWFLPYFTLHRIQKINSVCQRVKMKGKLKTFKNIEEILKLLCDLGVEKDFSKRHPRTDHKLKH